MTMAQNQFGEHVWSALCDRPLGSLTKRELELLLVQAAIDAGLVESVPRVIAKTFRLSLTKAHSYLTDLALRSSELDDLTATKLLSELLCKAEVASDGNHLTIPLNDARLRIWLERILSTHGYHLGESLRRDIVKFTPNALLRILDNSHGVQKPYDALKYLSKKFKGELWITEAKVHWKPDTPWSDALKGVAIGNFANILLKLIGISIGLPLS